LVSGNQREYSPRPPEKTKPVTGLIATDKILSLCVILASAFILYPSSSLYFQIRTVLSLPTVANFFPSAEN